MQVALNDHNDKIIAGPDAPLQAICPACGAPVELRKRTAMDGSLTWYWQHRANANLDCPRRCQVGRARRKEHLYRELYPGNPSRRKREKPDWRLSVRFRHGEDDDLIEYLRTLPTGYRAVVIRAAVRQAVQTGMIYDRCWSQGPHRDIPDVKIAIRFHHGEDDQVIAYLQSLPSRHRSAFVRQAMRAIRKSRVAG